MVPIASLENYPLEEAGLVAPRSEEIVGYARGQKPIIAVRLLQACQVVYGYAQLRWEEKRRAPQVAVRLLALDKVEREAFVRLDLDPNPYSKGQACKVLTRSGNLASKLGVERVTREALGRLVNISDATIGAWMTLSDMSEQTRAKFASVGDTRALQQIAALPEERQEELARILPDLENKRGFTIKYAQFLKANPDAKIEEVKANISAQGAVKVDLKAISSQDEGYMRLLSLPQLKGLNDSELIDFSVYELIFENIIQQALDRGVDAGRILVD